MEFFQLMLIMLKAIGHERATRGKWKKNTFCSRQRTSVSKGHGERKRFKFQRLNKGSCGSKTGMEKIQAGHRSCRMLLV